jgi:transposase-like protein
MKSNQRQNRVFSTSFKKEKVKLIEEGKLSVNELSKVYDVSATAIYKWIAKYGKIPKEERIVVEKKSEEAKTLALMKKVAELEQMIGKQQVELMYKDAVIELGGELLGTDLKKKYKSLQSNE